MNTVYHIPKAIMAKAGWKSPYRVSEQPLRCSIDPLVSSEYPHDPREARVQQRPASPAPPDHYMATEASIAIARETAMVERVLARLEVIDSRRQEARVAVQKAVQEFGLDEVLGWLEQEQA